LKNIPNIKNIHVVAQDGEVKEVLCEIDYDVDTLDTDVKIVAVDINDQTLKFSSNFGRQEAPFTTNNLNQKYFYEASSAIVKAGIGLAYGKSLGLSSLSKQSSYFVSDTKFEHFMGRRFELVGAFIFSKKI
jgi:hypothetical protein